MAVLSPTTGSRSEPSENLQSEEIVGCFPIALKVQKRVPLLKLSVIFLLPRYTLIAPPFQPSVVCDFNQLSAIWPPRGRQGAIFYFAVCTFDFDNCIFLNLSFSICDFEIVSGVGFELLPDTCNLLH